MISGLLKQQLVNFLTAKLVQSPLFNKGVAKAHGTYTELSEQAYTALERATLQGQKTIPTRATSDSRNSSNNSAAPTARPPPRRARPSPAPSTPSIDSQKESALRDYIDRMRKDLEASKKS